MRTLTALAAIAALLPAQTRRVSDDEVAQVHRAALLIDTHNDVTSDTVKGLDIGPRRAKGHTDIPRLREGGVGAVFFAAYVAKDYVTGNRSAHRTLEMIDTIRHDIVARHPDTFTLALTADQIAATRRAGKIAALIGIEGGHAIEDSPRLLRTFYDLGVRYMTLTHTNDNHWADSSGSATQTNKGLNALGRSIIAEMNRLGMMVDISHASDKTFWDVLAVSTAPVFASHSSSRELSAIPRNMTDEMISALARKGGVVQINFGCQFVAADPKAKPPRAALSDIIRHIQHVSKVGGIDALGIGSDFDGVSCVPQGMEDVSRFPALTRALLENGYTPEQIHKIYGGNLLRVMRAVEQKAGK
ncbi:MAG: membrane dipeptidase [Acidobacteria bacterium]|nr:membrane dipeptidase [Acidobacteriota bacterium]